MEESRDERKGMEKEDSSDGYEMLELIEIPPMTVEPLVLESFEDNKEIVYQEERHELETAATTGDTDVLKKIAPDKPDKFFHPYLSMSYDNIYHLAARENKVNFFKEAMNILPLDITLSLLSKSDSTKLYTPLHYAASHLNLELVRSIVGFYKNRAPDGSTPFKRYPKPWQTLTRLHPENMTPLHLALRTVGKETNGDTGKLQIIEDCALEILSLDVGFFCAKPEYGGGQGVGLLYCAALNGLSRLALEILNTSSPYCVTGHDGYTPLHVATRCSDEVLKLMLKKHPEMIDCITTDHKWSVLHLWASSKPFSTNVLDELPEIKNKLFTKIIYWENDAGCNALHQAATNCLRVVEVIVQCYQDAMAAAGLTIGTDTHTPPWLKKSRLGNTPLHLALKSKKQEVALYILSLDKTLCDVLNHNGESPLYVAVANGCDIFVKYILENHDLRYKMAVLRCINGSTVLHNLHMLQEETGRMLLEKYWWMMNLHDDKDLTVLDKARNRRAGWLVELLMNPTSLNKEEFDWVEACKIEEPQAVRAFIESCQDLQKICRDKKDTPLHHIKLHSYEEYSDLLKSRYITAVIKNLANSEGDTPLHRALNPKRKDMYLAKALLSDKEVLRGVENKKHQTAMKLLQKLHKNVDWKLMCKEIEVDPFTKTGYITDGTDLGEMRTTLSVIAALLATITFAAGFTLPGGLDENTGEAKLAKRAAFIVFLISDTYAMCTSMLVLFLLIWSMVSNRTTMSRLLVDRSVFILMQALYGTMVAFMTCIYLVMANSSLWATILVIVMCSFTGILISAFLLHRLLKQMIPTMKRCFESLEEGNNDGSQKRD